MVDEIKDAEQKQQRFKFICQMKKCLKRQKASNLSNSNLSIYEVIKKNSLNLEEELKLKKYIEKKAIYLATPFSFKAARWLQKNKVRYLKSVLESVTIIL